VFIKNVKVKNFKCFVGEQELSFAYPTITDSGLNIFIGENNTGKSTVFEAIDFIRNGVPKGKKIQDLKNSRIAGDEMFVEVTFCGDIKKIIDSFAQKDKKDKLKSIIYTENNENLLKIKRDAGEPKKILVWDDATKEYKNFAGIEAPIQKIFEVDFIWADTNPNDITKFGSTTICGKLLGEILKSFTLDKVYSDFVSAHNKVFNDNEVGLKSKLKGISSRVENICKEQFGEASINFHFDEMDATSFFKNTRIKVDDGTETYLEEKGSGMQRSVALALLQVYAENLSKHPEQSETNKPFYIFIDEPEICLHPLAQIKLINAFESISKTKQIFLATHSPLIFKNCCSDKVGMFAFSKDFKISKLGKCNFNKIPWGPTWGEIIYFAYNLPTKEFHNELYGYLQEKTGKFDEKEFDVFLRDEGVVQDKVYKRQKNENILEYNTTICTYIRNQIHHPENKSNALYNDGELKISIDYMLSCIAPEAST
jgi:predicted ATP-dependent endonuclease of OLD family